MVGWVVPPPRKPRKTGEEFARERDEKVRWLVEEGLLRSERIRMAMLRVPREEFIPEMYRDYAYLEVPLPIPGQQATISCPHSYPLFYEAISLRKGDRCLEVGTGSGYGAALAREVVEDDGLVVTVEIDPDTHKFAVANLRRLGYDDVVVVLGDGSLGYPTHAPYDKVCVTAACPRIPFPLIRQLNPEGKLAAPIGGPGSPQDLVMLEKGLDGAVKTRTIERVLYVPLRGEHGWRVLSSM